MNQTLKSLSKLRISGMLSEAACLEVERKILEKLTTDSLEKERNN